MITDTSKQGWWFGGDFRNLMPMGLLAAPPLWIAPISHHEQKAILSHLTKREAGNRGGA